MPLVNNFWGAIFLPNHLPFVLCSRRMFKRLSASVHSAEILSVTAQDLKSGVLREDLNFRGFYCLVLSMFCSCFSKLSITNYGNYQFSSTPPFYLKKPTWNLLLWAIAIILLELEAVKSLEASWNASHLRKMRQVLPKLSRPSESGSHCSSRTS